MDAASDYEAFIDSLGNETDEFNIDFAQGIETAYRYIGGYLSLAGRALW